MFSFPKWFCKFTAPPEVCGSLSCAISLQYLVFFVLAVFVGVLWHHIIILVCISLVTNEVEYFSDVYWPFGYPLLSSSIQVFCSLFLLNILFLINLKEIFFFPIQNVSPLLSMYCKCFFQYAGSIFTLLIMSFDE